MTEEEKKDYLEFMKKKKQELKKTTSKIYFFDENDNITDRNHAVTARICEYNEYGDLISETVGSISKNDDFNKKK